MFGLLLKKRALGRITMHLHQCTFYNSLHAFKIKVGGVLVIVYQLDLYQRWFVHIRLALGWGKFVELFSEVVGTASEYWIDNHFEDDDFENF